MLIAFSRRLARQPLVPLLFAARGRLIRFACVGGAAAVIQLTLLHLLTQHGWGATWAFVVAFLTAAQVNFLLHTTVTWHDRRGLAARASLLRRWLAFHGSISGTALLNVAVFTVAHLAIPALLAAMLGIAAAAAANFVTFDRFVFRAPRPVVSEASV